MGENIDKTVVATRMISKLPPTLNKPYRHSLVANNDGKSKDGGIECGFIPKPKYRKAKRIKKTNRARSRYFSSGDKVTDDNKRDLLMEVSPFKYPRDMEEFASRVMKKAWQEKMRVRELHNKYNMKHNIKTRNEADMLHCLYVCEPELRSLKLVTDIDPDFFKVIEGRPTPENKSIRKYVNTVRNVLRTKIITGFREDDILLIEENLLMERTMIEVINQDYLTYVGAFEEFLFNDHNASMGILKEADKIALLAAAKYEEYRQLSKEYAALRSILYNTEEKWRNCKLYQRFLYMLSPLPWRKQHDVYYKQKDEAARLHEDSGIFGRDPNALHESYSLEDLINQFKEDCTYEDEPLIYFEDPDQLLDVLRFIELQNLNSLLHTEGLAIPLENVKDGIKHAEFLFTNEITSLQELIDKLSEGITWEEQRAIYLEGLAKQLIEKEFKEVVVDPDFLNLQVLVEDIYETRIGPNDANLSIEELMKAIEQRFREELIRLDQIPSDVVIKVENANQIEETKILKIAEKASKELQEFEKLFVRLKKVFSPPHQRTKKELKQRSRPQNPPRRPPLPPRLLTEKEIEYLMYFTDFCPEIDNVEDYGIDVKQHRRRTSRKSFAI